MVCSMFSLYYLLLGVNLRKCRISWSFVKRYSLKFLRLHAPFLKRFKCPNRERVKRNKIGLFTISGLIISRRVAAVFTHPGVRQTPFD